jgi:hypothetical protein
VVYLSIPHQCIYSIHRVAQKRITRLIHFPWTCKWCLVMLVLACVL